MRLPRKRKQWHIVCGPSASSHALKWFIHVCCVHTQSHSYLYMCEYITIVNMAVSSSHRLHFFLFPRFEDWRTEMDCLGARSSTCNNSLNFCIVWNLQTKKQILGNTLNSQHPHHNDGIQSSELVWNLVRCHMRHSPKRAMQNKSPWRYSPICVNPNDNFNDSFISKRHKEWLKKTPKWLIPLAESPAQIYHCNADLWSGYPGK